MTSLAQVSARCADGVAESRMALHLARQRIRAERLIASSYEHLDEPAHGSVLGPVFGSGGELGAPHAMFAEKLALEVEAPLLANPPSIPPRADVACFVSSGHL